MTNKLSDYGRIWYKKDNCAEVSCGEHEKFENKFKHTLMNQIMSTFGIDYLHTSKEHMIYDMLNTSLDAPIKQLLEDYSKLKFEELFKWWKQSLKYHNVELPKESLEIYDIWRFELMPENFIKALLKHKSVDLDKKKE